MKKKIKKSARTDAWDELSLTEDPVFCLCREVDDGLPMIGCDKCNEWYHKRCLKISDSHYKHLQNVEYWSCPPSYSLII